LKRRQENILTENIRKRPSGGQGSRRTVPLIRRLGLFEILLNLIVKLEETKFITENGFDFF
jgi:hypothetical protein